MGYELIDITAEQIDLLREATIELHRHEIAVQPQLGPAPARGDDEYWELYRSRFAGWFDDGDGICVVARRDDGSVLGFAFSVVKQGLTAYDSGERIGYVEEIAVLESARGNGIGRALMDATRDRFAARGLTSFELSTVPGNDAARAFYTRLGLKPAAQLLIGEV